MARGHKSQLFLKFWLSYILVLSIPILIGVYAYHETLNIVERDALERNVSSLFAVRDVMDRRLSELDELAVQLSMNGKIREVMFLPNPTVNQAPMDKFIQAQGELKSYIAANNFIKDFFIYYNYNDIIMTPTATYLSLSSFYNAFFRFGDMKEVDFYNHMLNTNQQRRYITEPQVTRNGSVSQMVAYLQTIPLDTYGKIKGTVMVLIEKSEFDKLLNQLEISAGGWAYILDRKGNLITALSQTNEEVRPVEKGTPGDNGSFEHRMNGRKMIVSYASSSYNGWKYVVCIPYDTVMLKAGYLKKVIFIIILVVLLVGALLSTYLASRNSKPLKELIRLLLGVTEDNRNVKSEFEFLKSAISGLLNKNENLRKELEEQVRHLKGTLLQRLIYRDFNSSEEIQSMFGKIGFTPKSSRYAVLIIYISPAESEAGNTPMDGITVSRLLVKDMLQKKLGEQACWNDMDADKLVLLLNLACGAEEECRNSVEQVACDMKEHLSSHFKIRAYFSGSLMTDILDAGNAFEQAKQALRYKQVRNSEGVIWYQPLPENSEIYHYPPELEMRLINTVKSGDENVVRKLLEEIYTVNFEKKNLSSDIVKFLIYNMKSTLLKLMGQLKAEPPEAQGGYAWLKESGGAYLDYDEEFNAIRNSCIHICQNQKKEKKSSNSILKERIMEYINRNYTDSLLCLTSTAENAGISEVYLSQFFKEQTGYNFSTYLERVRMEHACDMLKSGVIPVHEIAEKAGYNSSHAFRNAFKRVMGMNPTDYCKSPEIWDTKYKETMRL